ncbi:MAG: signal recognition particle-docking protein FtsY [Candidatus Sericytochromatia bacterium]
MWFKRKDDKPQDPQQHSPTPETGLPPVTEAPPNAPEGAHPGAPHSPPEAPKKGFLARAWEALNKPVFDQDEEWAIKTRERMAETRKVLVNQVAVLVMGRGKIDDDLLDELEEILITADVGVDTTEELLTMLRKRARDEAMTPQQIPAALAAFLEERLGDAQPLSIQKDKLNVIMVVGVNGVGKTTTIGKLASRMQLQGHPVIVAAADTFRAAAIDQMEVWGERAGVEVIRHKHGGDSAAVVFDAIKAAQARGKEILLIDTAGRLHNKLNLMEELRKIRKIIDRELPGAEPQVLLVLDATTGQNGLKQAEVFKEATGLTGVILTKLDGTAKGGVLVALAEKFGLPVHAIGVGEKADDLRPFEAQKFAQSLLGLEQGADE